ncbi:MAG: hypothetical protein NC489_44125, partial [Ruminococcus flavefaciens]|nr:hypothetical protein [Ruminococcus flavefaciens]
GTEYKTISAAFCLSYAESIRGSYNEDKQEMLSEVIAYLDRAFSYRNKFLNKNNVPVVVVMAKVALENGIEETAFSGFVNMFANRIYPSYKEASGSGNVKAKSTQMRLRVMFLALCGHFGLVADEIKAPFADGIPLYEDLLEEDGLMPERGTPAVEDAEGSEEETAENPVDGEENHEASGEPPILLEEGEDALENDAEPEPDGGEAESMEV